MQWLVGAFLAFVLLPRPVWAGIEIPPETPIGGETVHFDSADGVQLIGHLFEPESDVPSQGAILFVHEPNRTSRDWAYMAEKLSRHGFVSLVFDLRGHGESLMRGDEELDREIFMDEDYLAMGHDVAAGLAFLRARPSVDPSKVHVAGSDLGASLVLLAAGGDEAIRSVAMLSPGLGYDGVNILGTLKTYGKRPLLMVFSVEDGYSRKSVEVLQKDAVGPTHVETYYGVGHGTKMLAREPKLEILLTAWFLGTIITEEGRRLEDTGKPMTEEIQVEEEAIDPEAERRRLEAAREAAEQASTGAIEEEEDEDKDRRWELEED